ncbi:hypothetical protein BV25DRAFT_1928493 [Artomyces pyxidatus]|uniref:Uncharacterized protein n=1 Tax=Artomyces pyxidatus TaxID=48021 RepID=A0ACB8SHU9_9AGAM|nr:hypothetical protein BV25DRAFT_1928493 [Artomyces pyxidatus]
MLMISAEIVNETAQILTRNAAGLAPKNALSAGEGARQTDYSNRWLAVDPETRAKIKQDVLMALHSPIQKAGNVAAQADPDILSLRANESLTAVVHGARKEEP